MSEFNDIKIICRDCGNEFIWSVGQQEFMYKLLDDEKITEVRTPRWCPDCKTKWKKNNPK